MKNARELMSRALAACDDRATEYDARTVAALKFDNNKSPMDKLSEILRRSDKKEVVYEVINVMKSSYGDTYIIHAGNSEITAIGKGTELYTAETNAALKLLNQIYDNVNNSIQMYSSNNVNQLASINEENQETVFHNKSTNVITSTSNMYRSPSPENKHFAGENSTIFLETNFISLLQDFCMTHHMHLPEYSFSQENVELSTSIYTVKCSLLTFETSGKGNFKRLAKRRAAYEMYLLVENLSEKEINNLKQKTSNYGSSRVSLMSLNKHSCCILSSKSIKSLEIFLSENYLSNEISIDFLDSIAKDEGFSVEYIAISKKSGNCVVLVQLLTYCVMVCAGNGKTLIEAKCSAVYSMLVNLQSLAKHCLQKI